MHGLLFVIAAVTLAGLVLSCVELVRGGRTLRRLGEEAAETTGPLVSVVVAARDEGPNIERAIQSLLTQRYTPLEIVAIDDRSADDTGAILDRMATTDTRLHVLHISELPPHWLGKNFALHSGAAVAKGELLLFTDADVVFDSEAIGRGVAFVKRHGVDHLTVGPEMDSPTALLALVVNFFAVGFLMFFRPWRAPDPTRSEHIGIGAFNLVRTSLYRSFGGHDRIALRPDDDLKLGRLVKLAGGRTAMAGGFGVIRVRWYSTVGELARGLRKNTFAGFNYSVSMVTGGVIILLIANVWPFVALFVTGGAIWWMNAVSALLLMSMFALVAKPGGGNPWLAIGYPLAALIFVYIVIAATWITVRRGGIEWRGTFYSLAELRRNVV